MKILVLSFLVTISAFGEVCLQGRSATEDGTGAIKGREVCYINAKNGSGGALLKGAVSILKLSSEDGFTADTSSTAGAVPVCVYMEACASGAVCKCQTYGYADYVNFDSTNVASSAGALAFISESTAGYIQAESPLAIAITDVPVGTFLEGLAASGDSKVWINLR